MVLLRRCAVNCLPELDRTYDSRQRHYRPCILLCRSPWLWEVFRAVRYVSVLALLIVPVFTYIAILRYHLYDIDVVINRTLVYGALSASVVGIYVLTIVALGALFQAQGNLGVSLVATGLVAVLFQPLRAGCSAVSTALCTVSATTHTR